MECFNFFQDIALERHKQTHKKIPTPIRNFIEVIKALSASGK